MFSFIQFCLTLARAILSDTRVRRQWMFCISIAVLVFVFGGYFLLSSLLQQHVWLFAAYATMSFVGLAIMFLLAFVDLLIVRRSYVEAKRAAARQALQDLAVKLTPPAGESPKTSENE